MSSPARARPAPQVLEARLERLTYVNEETGHTVARVTAGCEPDLVTVVGALLGAQPGESLLMRGWWSHAAFFNGTAAVVTVLDSVEQAPTVRTDEDEDVCYEADELAHAYPMRIHGFQRSAYPAVVVPMTTSAWMTVQRNLRYSAVTRARKLVVLVGFRRAVAAAVRTVGAGRRHTTLGHRLRA